MPECPDTIEEFEEQVKQLKLCRVTLYNQAKARIEAGAAKSVSEAARQLAEETGRSARTIRNMITNEQTAHDGQLSQLSGTDKHRPFASSRQRLNRPPAGRTGVSRTKGICFLS